MMISQRKALLFSWLLGLGIVSMPSFVQAEEEELTSSQADLFKRIRKCRNQLRRSMRFMGDLYYNLGIEEYGGLYYDQDFANALFNNKYDISRITGGSRSVTRRKAREALIKLECDELGKYQIENTNPEGADKYTLVGEYNLTHGLINILYCLYSKKFTKDSFIPRPVVIIKESALSNDAETSNFDSLDLDSNEVFKNKNLLEDWNKAWSNTWDELEVKPSSPISFKRIVLTYYKAERLLSKIDSFFHRVHAQYFKYLMNEQGNNMSQERKELVKYYIKQYRNRAEQLVDYKKNRESEFLDSNIFFPRGMSQDTLYIMMSRIIPRGSTLKEDMKEIKSYIKYYIQDDEDEE